MLSDAVEQTKQFCQFGTGKKFGVLIGNEFFDDFIKHFEVLKIVNLTPDKPMFQSLPTLYYCKHQDKEILVA
mgnify:CR=1 FL=1